MNSRFLRYILIYIMCAGVLVGCDNETEIVSDVIPILEDFSPKSALVGDEVTFTGAGFGDYRADADAHVYFNGTEVTQFVKYSDKRIVVKVPEDATSGNVTLQINGTELVTEEAFTVKEPEPEVTELLVTGFSPMEGYAFNEVTISGYNFGSSVNSVTVEFNGVEAEEILSVSDREIKVVVPDGATTGLIKVKVSSEEYTTTDEFVCNEGATVTSVSPAEAWAGELITLTGENFFTDVPLSDIRVRFKDGSAIPESVTANEIKVKVPAEGNTATLYVDFGEKQTVKGPFFQVYKLFENDFNNGSSYSPFIDSPVWAPSTVNVENNYLKFYYNYAALAADNRRERRGCEVACDLMVVTDGWYGFKVFLPSGLYPENVTGTIIAQMFNVGDRSSWAGHVSIENNKLVLSHRNALVDPVTGEFGTIPFNTWVSVVVYFKVGINGKGNLKAWSWIDGETPETYEAPDYEFSNGDFGFGEWIDDNTLNCEVTKTNLIGDYISSKFGMYVQWPADLTIYFDDIKALQGNPEGAFDIVKPE
ncbi:IPT/TIG domain-containing protein [Bacteroides sp.]|uniref:IPT/TIG domain-containing protein n=1 Tax=Bacteroides sp. TaxID=29523 RepID=UPI0025C52CFB|nr:IPT/TIG domain-containing protein [Bacteroides sp.]